MLAGFPPRKDLESVVEAIDRVGRQEGDREETGNEGPSCESPTDEIERDERGWQRTLARPGRHRRNKWMGVDVSSRLELVPSSLFSRLQC